MGTTFFINIPLKHHSSNLYQILAVLLCFICLCKSVTINAQTNSDTIRVNIEDADYMKGFSDSLRLLVGEVFLSQYDEQLIFLCDSASIFDNSQSFNAYYGVHLQQSDTINIYSDIMKYRTSNKIANLYRNVYLTDGVADIYADTLIYNVATRQASLIPKVHISVDSTDIYADSIAYNTRNKQADLFRNVSLKNGEMLIESEEMDYNLRTETGHYVNGGKLTNKETTLTSNDAIYYGKKDLVVFENEVVYKDSTYILNTENLTYNLKTEQAVFKGKSTITNEGNTIVCNEGFYDAKTKKVTVQGDAVIQQENNLLKADSLNFDNDTGMGYAIGNVFWEDTLENISIAGEYIEFEDSSNYVMATKRPLMISITEHKNKANDTLYLMADTLFTKEIADSVRAFEAVNDVLVFKKDFQAKSEFLAYNELDSVFTFYGSPTLWLEETQLYADTIILETKDGNPLKFSLLGNAYMGSVVQEKIYDQISGSIIYGYFVEGDLKNIEVIENARSIYFVQDDKDQSFIGVNQSNAKDMYIDVDSNQVQQINYIEKAKAKFLTMNSVDPFSLRLEGFEWKDNIRPKSLDDLLESRVPTEADAIASTDEGEAETKPNQKASTPKRGFGSIGKSRKEKKKDKKEAKKSSAKKREAEVITIKAE